MGHKLNNYGTFYAHLDRKNVRNMILFPFNYISSYFKKSSGKSIAIHLSSIGSGIAIHF